MIALQNSAASSQDILDLIDKVTKISALVIGGAWAYQNYLRGRTFKKRLELRISGREIPIKDARLLSGTALIKNVGLSKFPIEQRGTGILLISLKAPAPSQGSAKMLEEEIGVSEVFTDHAWIEPGETISEDFLVRLPADDERVAMKLDLRVVAAGIEWNAKCIATTANSVRTTQGCGQTGE